MKKKLLAVILILVLSVLAACSNSNNNVSKDDTAKVNAPKDNEIKQETITWWVPNWDEEIAKTMVADFVTKNPNIKVELVTTTWDTMENKIRIALMTNTAPDLITELESRIPAYAAQGLLTDLTTYVEKSFGKADIITSALEINSYNDGLYGIPYRHDGAGIIYNKGLFEKAGLDPDQFPTTWNEFLEAANTLTIDTDKDGQIDQYGTAWPFGNQPNSVTRFLQLLFSNDGDLLSADGKSAALNSQASIKAMTELTNTITKSGIAPKSSMELDSTMVRGLFTNEKIAMYITGQYDLEPLKEENPNIELGTAVLPGPKGMGTTTVNGFSLFIPNSSTHKDATWKLIDYIAEVDNMAKLTTTFPGRISALSMPQFNDELLRPFAKQLENGKPEPSFASWPEVEKIIYNSIQMIILKDLDVATAMEDLTKEVNAVLSKN